MFFDFDFAETKVDAEQPEQTSADHCPEHAETKVGPESEALFTEGHEPTRKRAGERADDQPDDDFANSHRWDGLSWRCMGARKKSEGRAL
jgi:hypothetical protein